MEAEALIAQARLSEAEPLLSDPIPASIESKQLEVRRLIDKADAWSKSNRREDAIGLLQRVQSDATDATLQIRINVLVGGVLAHLGDLDAAEASLNTALDRAMERKDVYQQASALLNLSYCKRQRYRYGEAAEFGKRALLLAEAKGLRRVAAGANTNLGSYYKFLGDLERASNHEKRAVELFSAIHDPANLLIALGELGLLYEVQDEFERAIQAYQRAYDLAKSLNQSKDAARVAVNLSEAYIENDQWNVAEEWNEQSRKSDPGGGSSEPYQILNAARIADHRGQTDLAIRMYQEIVNRPGVPPTLVWNCDSFLAMIRVQQKKYAGADREYRALLKVIDQTRSDLLEPQFKITFLSSLIRFHQDYVDLLVTQNDDANALRIIESSRARVLTERLVGKDAAIPNSIDLPQLKQLAKETNTSLLSFWIAPKRSFAWLIDKSGVHRFDLPPEDQIESLVTAYRETVEHALRDPIAAADPNGPKLWNALFAQIALKIPKNSRVVIIPDGPLHRLNFETLPVPSPTPHYWIEDVELAIAPSLAIAASKPEPARQGNPSLLLIGAPDYTGTDFRPLDKAGAEIHDIEARFPKLEQAVYTGRQASPDAYRASQPARFSLIHFAAHAEASHESPLESAVVLSRHGDSNKLYARDVIDQPIHADLVTISGCRSAGVRAYAGEGLIGFAWAFLQAGARSVVAGLWDVSDSSTEPLMNQFYAGIAAGQPPSTAMRNAKLALLKGDAGYSKPYYWAPFQVYLRTIRK